MSEIDSDSNDSVPIWRYLTYGLNALILGPFGSWLFSTGVRQGSYGVAEELAFWFGLSAFVAAHVIWTVFVSEGAAELLYTLSSLILLAGLLYGLLWLEHAPFLLQVVVILAALTVGWNLFYRMKFRTTESVQG